MTQTSTQNRRFVLAERPRGEPDDNTLRFETGDLPTPAKGQMLLRNEYLSLDPYMRGRMRRIVVSIRLRSIMPRRPTR